MPRRTTRHKAEDTKHLSMMENLVDDIAENMEHEEKREENSPKCEEEHRENAEEHQKGVDSPRH